MPDLSTTYLGLPLRNPVVVGSSGFTRSLDRVRACEDAGAGAVVLKSIFEEQIQTQVDSLMTDSSAAIWHTEAAEYISTYGREDAVASYLDTIRQVKKAVSIPVIASVNCVTAGGWTEFAGRLEQAGADALELNVLVLPADPRRDSQANEQVHVDVAAKVAKQVSIPVSLKIGFYSSGLARLALRLSGTGLKGLVLFNRPFPIDFDIENLEVTAGTVTSTPEEITLPLRWIAMLFGKVECDFAATTGIHDGTGAVKAILAGARTVQVCSSLYLHGLERVGTILGEIETWMDSHGFDDLGSFQGKLSQVLSNDPAAYERVQFMKRSVSQEA